MQNVSIGETLSEIQSLFSDKNKKSIINLLSAEIAKRVIKVKPCGRKTKNWRPLRSKDSKQPVQPGNLFRVFTICLDNKEIL